MCKLDSEFNGCCIQLVGTVSSVVHLFEAMILQRTPPSSLQSPRVQSRRHLLNTTRCAQASSVAVQDIRNATKVRLVTAADCELAVSIYPRFSYNASSGGGSGTVKQIEDNKLQITFDPSELYIPDLNWKTARVLGLPIPPPLNIAIQPNKFEGILDVSSGQMDLEFSADFVFTAGGLYKAPALKVSTTLTTEHSQGEIHAADGVRLSKDGQVKLVGVARVPKVDDVFLKTFLMLPTDALAVMKAELVFS